MSGFFNSVIRLGLFYISTSNIYLVSTYSVYSGRFARGNNVSYQLESTLYDYDRGYINRN